MILAGFALRPGHRVKLLHGGQGLFPELLNAINGAEHEVRFESYIFNDDAVGAQMIEALVGAARRGISVYLVLDGVGTPDLPAGWKLRLGEAGVHWHIFSPMGRLGLLIPRRWRRLHRKLCVVDGEVAFCGGINVMDDLIDPNHGRLSAPRFDFAVRVSGPLVQQVHGALTQFWLRMQAVDDTRRIHVVKAWKNLQAALALSRQEPYPNTSLRAELVGGASATLLLRDNVRNRSRIEKAYRRAIGHARVEIIIANAYFLPGRKLRLGLIHAAQRGVRVQLLLQGRYEYFMQYHAARLVYGELLEAGVEIHEYAASFLHAKVAVIDGHWSTVGSSNLDPLSLLLAREANLVIEDDAFACELGQSLRQAIAQEGRRVDPKDHAKRPWTQRLMNLLAYAIMRTALFLIGKRY
jgi:cardiolipin synthase